MILPPQPTRPPATLVWGAPGIRLRAPSLIPAIGLAGALALAFLAAGPGMLAAATHPAVTTDPATPSGAIATADAQVPRDLCILTDFFLVGGFANGQWLTADGIKPLIRGGEVYRRYSPLAKTGEWMGGKPLTEEGPGEWIRIPGKEAALPADDEPSDDDGAGDDDETEDGALPPGDGADATASRAIGQATGREHGDQPATPAGRETRPFPHPEGGAETDAGPEARHPASTTPDVDDEAADEQAGHDGLSISCAWNPFPRPPKAQGLQGKAYLDEVRARLRSNRLQAEPVVTESFRFDLEGDGVDEVLVIATNADATIPVFRKNTYTLVLFRRLVGGKVETTVLHEAYYREDRSGEADSPTGYSFGGVFDLNGDGRLELILRNRYYEGSGVEVHVLEGNRLRRVLSEGVGA
ncbi:MAG: hypothetical protein GX442_00890 [Candidatus Riflebacteria bacterium]|nr:hypothetical protein [Candidatus Riflebacteria bacterium]